MGLTLSGFLRPCKTDAVHNFSRREKLRWYRCKQAIWQNAGVVGGLGVIGGGLMLAAALSGSQRTWWWFGAVVLLASAYVLITGFRAGIGVGHNGVLVRSMLGRSRWMLWPEIERFSIVRRRVPRGGQVAVIAVIFVDSRKPLLADACALERWGKDWTKVNLKMGAIQNALENARGGIPGP